MSRRGRKLSLRDLASDEILFFDGTDVCSDSYTRCRRESESSLSGSSAFEEGELDEQECPVCYENLDETNIAVLKRGCGHKFCLTCLLRWSRVKSTCPLCQSDYTHVTSYYTPDGSFKETLVDSPIEYMSRITWLDIDFITTPTASPRLPRDDRVIIEDDMYGRYTFDELDDEFDLRNFAPSRGKDGRRRKSDAGCVSVTPSARSFVDRQTPNQNGGCNESIPQLNANLKLGRRARRALMRRMADEKANTEQL